MFSKVLLTIILAAGSVPAFAGSEGGHGGDICSIEFVQMGRDIVGWLKKAPPTSYGFPLKKLEKAITKTKVECTKDELKVKKIEKDAKNFHRKWYILVYRPTWEKSDTYRSRAKLDLHEYLGAAGLDDSKYQLSIPALEASRFFFRLGVSGSSSYEERIVNNDGSITIVHPYYTDDGKKLPLYAINGGVTSSEYVCLRYGLGDYIEHDSSEVAATPAAVVGPDGKYLTQRTFDERCRPDGTFWGSQGGACTNTVINMISCKARSIAPEQDYPTVYDRAEKVAFDEEGNVTITRPFAYGANHSKYFLRTRSMDNISTWRSHDPTQEEASKMLQQEYAGQCRYLGFYQFVSVQVSRDMKPAFEVTSKGEFNFFTYGPAYTVESITCKP